MLRDACSVQARVSPVPSKRKEGTFRHQYAACSVGSPLLTGGIVCHESIHAVA